MTHFHLNPHLVMRITNRLPAYHITACSLRDRTVWSLYVTWRV